MKGMLKKALAGVAAAALAVTGLAAVSSTANADVVSSADITLTGEVEVGQTFDVYKIGDYMNPQVDESDSVTSVDVVSVESWEDLLESAIQSTSASNDYADSEYNGNPAAYIASLDTTVDGDVLREIVSELETMIQDEDTNTPESVTRVTADGDDVANGFVTIPVEDDGLYLIIDSAGSPILIGSPIQTDDNEYQDEINDTQLGKAYLKPDETPAPDKAVSTDTSFDGESVYVGQELTYTVTSTISGSTGQSSYDWITRDVADPGLTIDEVTGVTLDDDPVTYWDGTGVEPAGVYYTVRIDSTDENTTTVVTVHNVGNRDGQEVVVTYTATVNENAVSDPDGVTNTAQVGHIEDSLGATDTVTVKTYGFSFQKVSADDGDPLEDAKFQITKNDGEDPLTFTCDENSETYVYDASGTVTSLESGSDGMIRVAGLGDGTYTVTEIEAPEGYFQTGLPSFTVTISTDGVEFSTNIMGDFSGLVSVSEEKDTATVENMDSITQLPVTGAAGIALFVVIGVLIAGAGVTVYMKSRSMRNAMRA